MPGSKFKLLPGIIVPNRKNAICQFWSNRALLFAEIIVAPGHVRYKKIVANGNYSSVNGSNYFCA